MNFRVAVLLSLAICFHTQDMAVCTNPHINRLKEPNLLNLGNKIPFQVWQINILMDLHPYKILIQLIARKLFTCFFWQQMFLGYFYGSRNVPHFLWTLDLITGTIFSSNLSYYFYCWCVLFMWTHWFKTPCNRHFQI